MRKLLNRYCMALVWLVPLLFMTSCKSQYEMMLESHNIPAKYKMAFELFNSGKYTKAANMFESLKIAVRGTPQDDTVHFYAAYSHYRFRDVASAEQGFESFIRAFPASTFIDRARYMYVDCLYRSTYRYELDQTPTYRAMAAIAQYLIDYPDNEYTERCHLMMEDLEERLDRKEYEAARIYYTMEDYRAAYYALKLVLKEDAENRYREDIMYYTVMSAYKYANNSTHRRQRDRFMVFSDEYYTFVSEFPESGHRKELDALATRVQNILNKQ